MQDKAYAMWVAAPLLPGTMEQKEAASLYQLLTTGNENLAVVLKKSISDTKLDTGLLNADPLLIKQEIIARIQYAKFISPHYMHVDGTSFAAPILASVTAQMLEADHSLTPQAIRTILFGTARRLEGISAIRQGYGLVQPRRAVLKVLQRKTPGAGTRGGSFSSPLVNRDANTIAFFIENSCAEEISVAGSFNCWAQDVHQMKALENGVWKVELPMLPRGKYHYKFFIDRKQWVEDVINPYREPDGFNGFNSVLLIEN